MAVLVPVRPVGGVPVAEFDLGTLRDQFSTVSQDAALFDETLRENIDPGHRAVLERVLAGGDLAVPTPPGTTSLDLVVDLAPIGNTSACAENTHHTTGSTSDKGNYLRVRGEYASHRSFSCFQSSYSLMCQVWFLGLPHSAGGSHPGFHLRFFPLGLS